MWGNCHTPTHQERERERERDRQTDRQTNSHTETEGGREGGKESDRQRQRERERERERNFLDMLRAMSNFRLLYCVTFASLSERRAGRKGAGNRSKTKGRQRDEASYPNTSDCERGESIIGSSRDLVVSIRTPG